MSIFQCFCLKQSKSNKGEKTIQNRLPTIGEPLIEKKTLNYVSEATEMEQISHRGTDLQLRDTIHNPQHLNQQQTPEKEQITALKTM
jgi:hypothetical protein